MNERALIAFLILFALIVLVNFAMFGIVRGWARGDTRWMNALRDSLNKPLESKDKSMDELRRRMEELESKRKE